MLAEERQRIIVEEIDMHGKVQVVSMAKQLKVSMETIRRDIDTIVKTENVKRVHGGAIKVTYQDSEPSYQHREDLNLEAKKSIGRKAATLINDGDIIFLDTGTTIQQLANYIKGKERLIILTNSLPTGMLLNNSLEKGEFKGKLIILGGEVSTEQKTISGKLTEEMLRNFFVDKAFLSVGGVSNQFGISDYDIDEAEITKIACSIAKETIVLADSSKIDVRALTLVAPLESVNRIISDSPAPKSWEDQLDKNRVIWEEVIY